MEKIHNNLIIDNLMKTEWFNQFDGLQQFEIYKGIKSNVDVFKYFTWIEMFDIRLCLKANQTHVLIYFAKIMDFFDKIQEKIIEKRKLKKKERN